MCFSANQLTLNVIKIPIPLLFHPRLMVQRSCLLLQRVPYFGVLRSTQFLLKHEQPTRQQTPTKLVLTIVGPCRWRHGLIQAIPMFGQHLSARSELAMVGSARIEAPSQRTVVGNSDYQDLSGRHRLMTYRINRRRWKIFTKMIELGQNVYVEID